MINVSDTSCRENQNTHFMLNDFSLENRVFYETMWKNIVQPGRTQITIWDMSIACWINEAINTFRMCNT